MHLPLLKPTFDVVALSLNNVASRSAGCERLYGFFLFTTFEEINLVRLSIGAMCWVLNSSA